MIYRSDTYGRVERRSLDRHAGLSTRGLHVLGLLICLFADVIW